nr:DUF4190 domain-containing protein [Nocardiopsis mwathae]
MWGLIFSTAGLVLLFPFGALLCVIGIYQGRKARRAAKENTTTAPGAVPSMVLGWLGLVLAAFMYMGMLMFWDEVEAYQQCSSRAHTVSTQQQCDEALQEGLRDAIAERTGVPKENVRIPNIGA